MRDRHCCLIDTTEGGVKNTSTLQGTTLALSRIEGDTTDKGRTGRLPAISQNTQSPKSSASQDIFGATIMPENPADCGLQNVKAKSKKSRIVAHIARLVKKEGLDYDAWRYVAKKVRRLCELKPEMKGRRLPRVLTTEEFRRFYQIVDHAEDVQHALMLRLLFFTAVKVSELCNIGISEVDLETCKIRVNQGKGSKDRYVLFGKGFATALRTHMAAHPHNRWLFQTRRHGKFSTRRVQQIVSKYAEEAGVKATPHTFRHQAITG